MRTRPNELDDFLQREARAEQFDAGRAALERFGEFIPPRSTFRQVCRDCAGANSVDENACPACGGKGWRYAF